jgi:competence protein ComEC
LRDKSWLDAWRHLLRALVGRLARDVGLALANWPLLALTGLPAGILVYFALPGEPPVWLGPLAVLASLLGFAWVQRWRQTKLRAISTDRQGGALWISLAALVVAGLVMASLGLAAASLRTVWMATPSLERLSSPRP